MEKHRAYNQQTPKLQNDGQWLAVYSVEELVGFFNVETRDLVWANHTSESPKGYPRFSLTTRSEVQPPVVGRPTALV